MERLRGVVVGVGSMGKNHARVLSSFPDIDLVAVVDGDPERAGASAESTGALALTSVADLGEVDFAVVAVPTPYHLDVASTLIARGTHVLVEKPLASTVQDCEALVAQAAAAKVILAVGHIERFNSAMSTLQAIVSDSRMISFERLSPFTPRITDSIVMDLMVHDLDIALWLLGGYPMKIEAVGARVFSDSLDIASAVLEFAGGRVVTLQASRATQDKVRRVTVSEPERFIVADSMTQTISIKRHTTVEYTSADGAAIFKQASMVETPYLDRAGEPLARELRDFIDAIRTGRTPAVTGADGLAAVRLSREIEERIAGT